MSDETPKRAGLSDKEWLARLFETQRAEEAAKLARAKEEAVVRGKEAFDIDKLDTLWMRFMDPKLRPPREKRIEELEWKYYVGYPDVMTIAEFADVMKKLEMDGAFD